jgi:hypothetical protein
MENGKTHISLVRDELVSPIDPGDFVSLGDWVWVNQWNDKHCVPGIGPAGYAFACVTKIGSNFVEVQSPHSKNGYSHEKIHFDDVMRRLRPESKPNAVLTEMAKLFSEEACVLLDQVKAITARLGVNPHQLAQGGSGDSSRDLVSLSGTTDVRVYESQLIEARDVLLPDLFQKIKEANENHAKWLSASAMSSKVQMGLLEESIERIENRVFNVSLYAGLTESVVQIRHGAAASIETRLRIMQRRAYMDEEALLGYETGGMEFGDISEFDEWLARPQNFERILPFNRCIVSMRVRRYSKERDAVDLSDAMINFRLQELDKLTFLYIRNGENLYRMNCAQDFGDLLFPDKSIFTSGEPLMINVWGDRVKGFMSRAEFEFLKNEQENWRNWRKENPDASLGDNPFKNHYFSTNEWSPFDTSSVHYDAAVKFQTDQLNQFNRISLIIQGLFDRSEVLHPHRPVRLWDQSSFDEAVELIRDGVGVLYNGPKPDFEAYRAKCNASIDANSVITGQLQAWVEIETKKECDRLDNDWRVTSSFRPKRFTPYGNPGPGLISKMSSWMPRARKATFTWYRERLSRDRYDDTPVKASLTVNDNVLFNVSAYRPGDFKMFFSDPRTREEYLKWAPILIAAEEYYAGNIALTDSI